MFRSVVARVWGENREMQLLGVTGFHVSAKSCDVGIPTFQLLTESDIIEGLDVFTEFRDSEIAKFTEM